MSAFTKEKQLGKTKKNNPNKMSRTEKIAYIDFIREKCKGVCQILECNNNAQDFAHKDRAYKRDDRHGALICRYHHTMADNPSPKQIDESSKVNLALSAVSKQNWRDYIS